MSPGLVLGRAALWIATISVIVLVEGARRNVRVDFAQRKIGERVLPARPAVLPVKINRAGYLAPTTVAPSILFLPLAFLTYIFGPDASWIAAAYKQLQPGSPGHVILGSVAVFAVAFIYTADVVDPEHAAAPGEATADYLDRVVSLTMVVGAVYLTVLQLIPEAFVAYGNALQYSMGGGAALIVVCTILDLQTQVRGLSLTDPGGGRR